MSDIASWPTSELLSVIGASMFLSSFGFGAYILVKKGKRRSMTHEEIKARVLNDDITDMPTWSAAGPGVGVRVEASATTDTLREHAARGEWGLFWCWPLMNLSWCVGTLLILIAITIETDRWIFAIVGGGLLGPISLAMLAMPFMALYTKLDTQQEDVMPDPPRPRPIQRS